MLPLEERQALTNVVLVQQRACPSAIVQLQKGFFVNLHRKVFFPNQNTAIVNLIKTHAHAYACVRQREGVVSERV